MVMSTQRGGSGSGLGSGADFESIDEQMQEFISLEITQGIFEQTTMIFGSVKEGILEILDECLGVFHTKVLAIVGACTLSFCVFRAYGDLTLSGDKDLIASRRWLADIAYAFNTSLCLEEEKVRFASCLLKDMTHN